MNPENQSSIDLGGGSREVYPEINIHPEISHVPMIDGQESEIKPETAEVNYPEGFEILAKSLAREENSKIIDVNESNDAAVVFQQDRIKDVLDIIKNNPENANEEIEKYWEEYDNMVREYAKEFREAGGENKILKTFLGYKRSVISSLGTIKFFKEQGFDAKFPTVRDDKLGACDLFFEKKDEKGGEYNLAVQLKSCTIEHAKDTLKNWQEILKNAISIKNFSLDEKDKLEFKKLQSHCTALNRELGKFYFPVFIKMPVSMNRKVSKRGELPYELVDKGGNIQNKKMKDELDILWEQIDTILTNHKNGLY